MFPQTINSQAVMQKSQQDRKPAVAGSFYPAEATQLRTLVSGFLKEGKPDQTSGVVRALVVPHAGYVFSGGVAASGYNQINPDHPYKRIFIIASSHRMSLGKASVYTRGDYLTPLGKMEVDKEVSAKLAANKEFFTDDPSAHIQEHSIEVQLPFLQISLTKPIPIVPIVVGTQLPSICKGIAEVLKPWFTADNLFIISADFSHYPSYENALKVDAATAEAFCTNSISGFLKVLEANDKLRIPDLATSMCAWPSALILLNLTENNPSLKFSRIQYKNSGDIRPYGDKASVVGYHSICISEKKSGQFELSDTDKKELVQIARTTLESYVRNRTIPEITTSGFSESLKTPAGAFVTLKSDGQLRGCIGSFEPSSPLFKVVQEMAIASSTRDSRFLPVQSKELKEIHIEISVLTPMKKIRDISEIKLGTHGIYIKKGFQGGTFLPQVATETGWTLEEFLGHCARDKAGIGWSGWKDADVFIYEAIIFEEE
ncbi:MAG: hypothetical protein A2X22_01065 [Bacteroidetes bacterium GWF2_49_14]|nr:MAG: hypothetical protein A2X22_01065 [Bacteroidetes bacterium GWF2_49_14]